MNRKSRALSLVLVLLGVLLLGLVAACSGAEPVEPQIVEVQKEVIVEKEVIKEVPVEKIVTVEVEKEVIREREVPVEKIVTREIIKEVPIEKIVTKEIIKEVEVPVPVVPKEAPALAQPTPALPAALVAEQDKYGGNLKVVSQASVKSIDPSFAPAYVTTVTSQHIFEQLFAWDANYVAQPQMVSSWKLTNDGKTYEITLRDRLTFHDEVPVTSHDVVASMGRWWEKQAAGKLVLESMIEGGIQAVDDRTFTITFTKPFGALLNASSIPHRYPAIFKKEVGELTAFEDIGEANLIGSGPYKLKLWEPGNRIVLERYEKYSPRSEPGSFLAGGSVPYLDEITWLEIPNEETKIAGLETGEWDLVDGAGLDFYDQLSNNRDIRIVSYPGHQSTIQIHVGVPPTDNKLVRQAILAAVDAEAFMSSLGPRELWSLCASAYYCNTPLESQGGADLYNQNNLEKARQLIKEAGAEGAVIKVMNPNDYGTITPLGLVLKPMLEDIGLTVEMPGMDWATLVSKIRGDDYNMFTTWWAQWAAADPITDVVVANTAGYAGDYSNPRFKELRLEYAAAQTAQERLRIVDEIQEIYYDEVPKLWLGQFSSIFPHRTSVQNLSVPAMPVFMNVWMDN